MAASVLKRGASICRSLTFTTKKDKEKTSRREAFLPITKGSMELREELKEEKVAWEEIEETYTLPEIPHTPLSGMYICTSLVSWTCLQILPPSRNSSSSDFTF